MSERWRWFALVLLALLIFGAEVRGQDQRALTVIDVLWADYDCGEHGCWRLESDDWPLDVTWDVPFQDMAQGRFVSYGSSPGVDGLIIFLSQRDSIHGACALVIAAGE